MFELLFPITHNESGIHGNAKTSCVQEVVIPTFVHSHTIRPSAPWWFSSSGTDDTPDLDHSLSNPTKQC